MARGVRTPDLTGRRFGRLAAVSATTLRGYSAYVCRCDCGAECVKRAVDLASGKATQCAPWDHGMLGRRFGRLKVLSHAGSDKGTGALFRCRCDCGRECVVPARSLKGGNTRSCGCGERENRADAGARMSPVTHRGGTNLSTIETQRPRSDNRSGVKGVCWAARRHAWKAYISVRGRRYVLGFYDDLASAAEARREAQELLHDPLLEALGRDPTSEEEYRRTLDEALGRLRDGGTWQG